VFPNLSGARSTLNFECPASHKIFVCKGILGPLEVISFLVVRGADFGNH